ncbi:SRPBCC family protein [Cohnella sp. AR92]|uniref:SRPBCC family protein n=1 Tax=Cohnella sp. AR92 TaxID=648716 RepID=UPI000F8DDB71|nr:SRPBCC family protein [Cohnella sp. AR92]RUS46305.1 polyketide cyclase [Cohnella sp. AR92]
MTTDNRMPTVKAEMLIRKSVEAVFEAFINPEVTTRFWFTKSSGRLEAGSKIRWEWEMYGAADEVQVLVLEKNRKLRIRWTDRSETEWRFVDRADRTTYVTITTSGYEGDEESRVNRAIDDMGGYTIVLCGLKAYLEHGVVLNLVADKAPDLNVNR